jgi:glycosyltransferase involved in cell wall biosynthesis
MKDVSAVILCRDEEAGIGRALKSLTGFAEILVLDSGSRDRTTAIAASLGATVIATDWPGYARQRQRAMEMASHPWCLFLDADEQLDACLSATILALEPPPQVDGYFLRRNNYFLGKPVRHSRWGDDWQLRLFRRSQARISPLAVHEGVSVDGASVKLFPGCIEHDTVPSLGKYIAKLNDYTTLEAAEKKAQGRHFGAMDLLLSPGAEFWKIYVVWQGWRDGMRGLAIAQLSALYKFMTVAKVMEAERG